MSHWITTLAPSHLLDSIGWAILHSLWQGILALVIVLLFRATSLKNSPATHYAVQLGCLCLCFLAFLITFAMYYNGPSHSSFAYSSSTLAQAAPAFLETGINSDVFSANKLGLITPIFGLCWCFGFFLMGTRYAGACFLTQRLKNQGVVHVSTYWTDRFKALAENSRVTSQVRLLVSEHVNGPLTIGFFKPVVLVPMSFLSSLPQDQIEAILLHELAHIRRSDYLFNLIQTAIKTVLFYHPAIHIICRYINEDREQACDDLAVQQTHDPHPLVLGLASLRLQQKTGLELAANDQQSPLLIRLQRLVGPIHRQKHPEQIVLSILTALLVGSFVVGSSSLAESASLSSNDDDQQIVTPHHQSYSFQTASVSDRSITVKIVEDGTRWVLVDNGWFNVDQNPDILKQLPLLPTPPQPPSPNWCESCELSGKRSYIDIEKFQKRMNQYQIEMEYYGADMTRYAQQTHEQSRSFYEQETEFYAEPNKNKLAQKILGMLQSDGLISSIYDTTIITQEDHNIQINGAELPPQLCGKYDDLIDQFEQTGELALRTPKPERKTKVHI